MTVMKLFIAACVIFSVITSISQAQPVVIKFSHVVSNNTPKGRGATLFKTMVESILEDRVTVEVYPSSQLYGDREEMFALLRGDIHLIAPSLAKFKQFTPTLQVFDLPFLFNDMEAVERFQASPTGQRLLSELSLFGYLGLSYWHNGLKQLSATVPLRVPTDADGLKFRVMTSDVLVAQFESVSANPQKMAFAEVYQALQTGAVDGQENTWSNIFTKKFYEVQPYITYSNHGLLEYLVLTNAGFWRALPDPIRTELDYILTGVTAYVNAIAAGLNDQARRNIAASGRTEIIELTAEQREQWRAAMLPVWQQFEEEIGADVIAAAAASN
jgi:C4-dicarboxylate-binding protein DctP